MVLLDIIKEAITPAKSQQPYKNIILWSTDHIVAEAFYKNMLQEQLGFEWAGQLQVDLHNMPIWQQWVAIQQRSPWCLSLTPDELFLSEYQNYEYGVSDNMMATHQQQIIHWIATKQIVTVQLGDSPELSRLQLEVIIKHE